MRNPKLVSDHGNVNHGNVYKLVAKIERETRFGKNNAEQARKRLQGVLRIILSLGKDDYTKRWRRIDIVARHMNEHSWMLAEGTAEERHEAALRLSLKFMALAFHDCLRVISGIAKEMNNRKEEFDNEKQVVDFKEVFSQMINGTFLSVDPSRFHKHLQENPTDEPENYQIH